ncbi:MAG TPA: carotenoid oxygenase family protein [Candidatus Dormibacteraeota bacterium]|nr:carotenoid oxygenase family protein [Candidatus Dormibacteraeota bacterium]
MANKSAAPTKFPSVDSFRGLNQPVRTECDIFELEYEGELPPALNGVYYRCGPDPQFPPRAGDDVYINGDGMVSMFRIEDGHVDFKMRYVRTDKFLRERQARRALFGAYRNPYTDDPSVRGVDRTTANTNVLWHGGRLFALKEDGLPHELDPWTLDTRGKWSFDGQLRSRTMTAHPKVDPVSGELVFFGYSAKGDELSTDIAFCTADADGELLLEEWFQPPYSSMIHDWGVTQEHVIFPIMPLAADPDRLRRGGPRWAWDPSKRTYLAVMPRRGTAADIVYFEGPPRWSFHVMNAFTSGTRVCIDLCVGEVAPFADHEGRSPDPERTAQYLTRWTCDLARGGGSFEERILWGGMHSDFPEVDRRVLTQAYRHGFMIAKDRSRPVNPEVAVGLSYNTIAHIDHLTGEVETYYVGEDAAVQEPVFVPRSLDAPEGDGYLLTVINRFPQARGEMVVFDTARLAAGPVATVRVPLFLRPVFHSTWVPMAELP